MDSSFLVAQCLHVKTCHVLLLGVSAHPLAVTQALMNSSDKCFLLELYFFRAKSAASPSTAPTAAPAAISAPKFECRLFSLPKVASVIADSAGVFKRELLYLRTC